MWCEPTARACVRVAGARFLGEALFRSCQRHLMLITPTCTIIRADNKTDAKRTLREIRILSQVRFVWLHGWKGVEEARGGGDAKSGCSGICGDEFFFCAIWCVCPTRVITLERSPRRRRQMDHENVIKIIDIFKPPSLDDFEDLYVRPPSSCVPSIMCSFLVACLPLTNTAFPPASAPCNRS